MEDKLKREWERITGNPYPKTDKHWRTYNSFREDIINTIGLPPSEDSTLIQTIGGNWTKGRVEWFTPKEKVVTKVNNKLPVTTPPKLPVTTPPKLPVTTPPKLPVTTKKGTAKLIKCGNEELSIRGWAKKIGISHVALLKRFKKGQSMDQIIKEYTE